jgi:HEXXH motif-containing protein
MLTVADAPRTVALRDRFMSTVLDDWLKVLAFARRKQLLVAQDIDLLAAAIGEVRVKGEVRSELVHYYFEALAHLNRRDPTGATEAIRLLGNTLLLDAADGVVTGDLPVAVTADGAVPLPAGPAAQPIELALAAGRVRSVHSRNAAEEIQAHAQRSWIAVATSGGGVGLRGLTEPIAYEITKYDERTSTLAGEPAMLRHLAVDGDVGPITAGYQDGFAFLRSADPGLAAEVSCLTEYVVPLAGKQFVGGSDIYLYGATFLRLDPDWSPLCVADHLVHEAAHQLLHAMQEIDPLLLNRDQVGQPSPIRSDARPLYGTFHATFVFLRLASFMLRVLDGPIDESAGEAEVRMHRHLLGLLQGLQILVEHGEFSREGQRELDSWVESARALAGPIGTPNARLYGQLTWDYEPADDTLPMIRL